jgi:hypothetical protein
VRLCAVNVGRHNEKLMQSSIDARGREKLVIERELVEIYMGENESEAWGRLF